MPKMAPLLCTGIAYHAAWPAGPGRSSVPWGVTDIPKNLIFRIILPQASFILTDYYPQAVFCDRANLANLSACFPASARISSAAGSP